MASFAYFAEPVEIGFCDGVGSGFYAEQPAEQVERWAPPLDNVARAGLSGYYPDITAIRILSRYYPDTHVLWFMLCYVRSGVQDSIIFHSTPFWERERIRILPRGAP